GAAGHRLDSSASERLRHRQQRTVRGPLMRVTDTTPELTIDADRLWSDLMDLAAIGAYDDEATGLVGVNRQSLTDEDRAGRELLHSWMEEPDLGITIDHIDAVAIACAFDRCVGGLGGVVCLRSCVSAGLPPRFPIVGGARTVEEAYRFVTDMLGSALAVGRLRLVHDSGPTDAESHRIAD